MELDERERQTFSKMLTGENERGFGRTRAIFKFPITVTGNSISL